jgi:hypothetical protein
MKCPGWILFLAAPAGMLLLLYLLLIPQPIEITRLDDPVIVLGLDPVENGIFDTLIDQGKLPALSAMIQSGTYGTLTQRRAYTSLQGWLEAMTGKDATQIQQAAATLEPETYLTKIKSHELTDRFANLKSIGKWHHKNTLCETPFKIDTVDDISAYDLIVGHIKHKDPDDFTYLKRCDRIIERLQEMGGKKAVWLIVSPLARNHDFRVFRINHWLKSKGYLSIRNGVISWEETQVFSLRSSESGIRIHRVEHYSRGTVSSENYVDIRKKLLGQLKAIIDPETDEPLFESFYNGRTYYPNRNIFQRPDIICKISPGSIPLLLDCSTNTIGENEAADPCVEFFTGSDDIPGMVSADGGWMLLSGSPFVKGAVLDGLLGVDITPTTLFLLGIPVASDMQGRILMTALREPWLKMPRQTVPSHERTDNRVEHEPYE